MQMKRKVVKTGSSLAVTLPREVVDAFGLEAGDEVDVSVHPQTSAVTIRPGIKYVEDGRVTKRFKAESRRVLDRYDEAFAELAK